MDTWVPSYGPGMSYPHLYGRHNTPGASVSLTQAGFEAYARSGGSGSNAVGVGGGSLKGTFDNLGTTRQQHQQLNNNNAGGGQVWPGGVAGGTVPMRVGGNTLYPSLPAVTYYTPTVALHSPNHGVHFQMVRWVT